MSRVGVVTFPTCIIEDCSSHRDGSSQKGCLKKLIVKKGMSVWPNMLIQLITGHRTAAAAKRSCVPDRPAGEHTTTRAATHIEAIGIDRRRLDHRIDPRHQVLMIDTGVPES